MKAAVRSGYGSPEVLSIKEVDMPTPKDHEVLVRVYAASVSRTDCHVLWGKPFVMRLFTGFLQPRFAVTGSDFAGQIEAIGKQVQSFRVGDRVMGFGGVFGCGSHAQYLAFPEAKAIIHIPGDLPYEKAAACLEGAFYAASGINGIQPKDGQKALVNGATGAIGSSMVQILKYYGLNITAVCSSEHEVLVRLLGAHKVIDYTTDDFTRDSEQYDFVFDAVGNSTFGQCKPLLKKNGIYSSSGGIGNMFWALVTPLLGGKKVQFSPPKNIKAGLLFIKDLIEKGCYKPVIDRKYPMEQIAEAYRYVASGQKIGNVILTMAA